MSRKRIINDDNDDVDEDLAAEILAHMGSENGKVLDELHPERVTYDDHPANLIDGANHDNDNTIGDDIIITSQFMITINSQQPAYIKGGTEKNPDYDDICESLRSAMDTIVNDRSILAKCGRDVPDYVGKFNSGSFDPESCEVFPDQYILNHTGDFDIHEGNKGTRGGRLHLHCQLTITHYHRYFLSYSSLKEEIESLIGNHRWFNGIYLHIRFVADLHQYIHHERH